MLKSYDFICINNDGTASRVARDKKSLFAQFPSLKQRDLHMIDKALHYRISAIMLRDNIILIKLYYIRCIITNDYVYIINSPEDNVPYNRIIDLRDCILKMIVDVNNPLAFEHKILEAVMINIRDYFDDIIGKLVPQVNTMFSNVEGDKLETIIRNKDYTQIYRYIVTLQSKVEDISDLLKDISEWDYDDFDDFYLSRGLNSDSDEKDNDRNKQIEDLIETYKGHFEENSDDIKHMLRIIDMTMKIVNVSLAHTRNKIARFDIRLNMIMISIVIVNIIASCYGMNVPNYIGESMYSFWAIVVIMFVLAIIIYVIQHCVYNRI